MAVDSAQLASAVKSQQGTEMFTVYPTTQVQTLLAATQSLWTGPYHLTYADVTAKHMGSKYASGKKDKEHHKRMSSDCRQMALDAESLKIEIGEAMLQKFGRKLNLKHLAEAILKKHISEMRSSVNKLRQEYDRKVFKMQTEVQERLEALSRIIQQNTEKKNLLIVLEAEKTKLWKLLNKQKTKQGGLTAAKLTKYSKDCDALNDVLRTQELEMEALRKEMRMLSFKSEPLPPISPSPITASPVQIVADITQKPNSNLNDEVNQ
ncbi:uncharacterized protein LOC126416998 [Schistocerca serialis cubense]|uniref:uncharacterized protein LOC126416998 n=1 Tax=Schistocerca serialis cubense TaxID=2023355 RepID=UPI00214E5C63|nr:uncharacterized protein LOC126416998 [Schistocerca serialis cubense]